MIKLLHVITDTNIGGAGILLCNLLRHIDRKKFEAGVVIPRTSALAEPLSDIGIRLIYTENGFDRSKDNKAKSEYMEIFARERPDIVHTHGAFSARVAAKKERVPIRVYTRHCAYPVPKMYSFGVIKYIFGKIDASLSHAAVAVADAAKQNLVDMGVHEDRIHVIINGSEKLRDVKESERVEIRRSAGADDNTLVLLMCARLEEVKGHRVLIDALSLLGKECDVKAIFLGDGSDADALSTYISEKGVADRVKFAGFQRDVAPYMAASDVNINCSRGTETSSLALSEGFSIGLPAIVSDYGGNPAMASHGGASVFPTDNSLALSEEIKRLYSDRTVLFEMSKKASAAYKEYFTASAMAEKYAELYEKLIGEFGIST